MGVEALPPSHVLTSESCLIIGLAEDKMSKLHRGALADHWQSMLVVKAKDASLKSCNVYYPC